ncbi:MAG: hypothetical protein GKR93_18000 [Gammaproteobacteria bacterium]|nr:hypothetical protein [Gammaproteobacteria bacterium]
MEKDFTIDVEVILRAKWSEPMTSHEEWKRRNLIDDSLGVLSCELEEVVQRLLEARR